MSDINTNTPVGKSQEARQSGLAPETHNDEQDDHRSQAQEVAEQARERGSAGSPTESVKGDNSSGLMGDSTQDTVDHMRDMESSGRIDMNAYRGEPNHDDNEGKYGKKNEVDPDLPNEND